MPDASLEARIATLDAQIQGILRDLNGLDKLYPSIKDVSDVEQKVAILETEVEVIKSRLDKKVDKNEFWPIKTIGYGLAGLILLAVIGTLLKVAVPFTGTVVKP